MSNEKLLGTGLTANGYKQAAKAAVSALEPLTLAGTWFLTWSATKQSATAK